jgi:hypothetical protein
MELAQLTDMKIPFALLLLVVLVSHSLTAGSVRTMENIPGLPVGAFRSELPAKIYHQLATEPIKAYLLVRGQIINNTVTGARVVRSEGNGIYDKVAVQIANGMSLYTFTIGTRIPSTVIVHILIYQLPKGEHAIAIAQDDTVGAANLIYSRSIRMRFLGLKGDTETPKKIKK